MYNTSSFGRQLYDLVCHQRCADEGASYTDGNGLGVCPNTRVVTTRYDSRSRQCGVFKSRSWRATTTLEGQCVCLCN